MVLTFLASHRNRGTGKTPRWRGTTQTSTATGRRHAPGASEEPTRSQTETVAQAGTHPAKVKVIDLRNWVTRSVAVRCSAGATAAPVNPEALSQPADDKDAARACEPQLRPGVLPPVAPPEDGPTHRKRQREEQHGEDPRLPVRGGLPSTDSAELIGSESISAVSHGWIVRRPGPEVTAAG
jgi:hypothetical protein